MKIISFDNFQVTTTFSFIFSLLECNMLHCKRVLLFYYFTILHVKSLFAIDMTTSAALALTHE